MSREIANKIMELVAEKLDVPRDTLTLKTRLREDLSADSLAVAEVGMGLDDMFDLDVEDDTVFDKVKTVQDAVDLVVKFGRRPS